MIFQHANRYQWHNDDPLYDGQRMLSRLQLPFVKSQGYVNLRCVWTLGCPAEIRPLKEFISPSENEGEVSEKARAGAFYKPAFEKLFPGVPVPEVIGASCCAQFAVTKDKIRERPKSDYESYRRWLLETTLPDDISGRILEYSWHSMDFSLPLHHLFGSLGLRLTDHSNFRQRCCALSECGAMLLRCLRALWVTMRE